MIFAKSRFIILALATAYLFALARFPETGKKQTTSTAIETSSPCVFVEDYFIDEVWAKVGEQTCVNCHTPDGDAADTKFLLVAPSRLQLGARPKAHEQNRRAFQTMAIRNRDGRSVLLQKITGGLDHGGGKVVPHDSLGYQILEKFVAEQTGNPQTENADGTNYKPGPFFENVIMLEPKRLLRRVTLSLAGRLPTDGEEQKVTDRGLAAFDEILDEVMTEEAFYNRLAEGFNDIFLTVGYDGVPERVLGYRNFGNTRGWASKFDLSHVPEKERQKARYKLVDQNRESILREPMELIRYIVRKQRPFTELVTADYIMVSPFTARSYGIFEEIEHKFKDPENHLEFIPAKLKELTTRDGKPDQETPTGMYPHAGMLTTFHYLKRYPTTETNRNRLRARMYYQHFLGIDIMSLAPRVTDAAAVDAAYQTPTMEAPDCVVCHKTVDPVAGLFQDFQNTNADFGPYGPRSDGWFEDMFGPGFEGESLPPGDGWRALDWLGDKTAQDPRFARTMVEHVYYILTGRKVLAPPQDISHPMFAARRRAYNEQRKMLEEIGVLFAEENYNLKFVFKALVQSKFYRADGLATGIMEPHRRTELDDIGILRILAPEQLDRKITAVFGKPWGKFGNQMKMLYGGINSKAVTERLSEPSGAMGAIQRIMANEVACKNVAADFALPINERRLFPFVQATDLLGINDVTDAKIRKSIVHLHQHILGRFDRNDGPEVNRTFELFADILLEAHSREGLDNRELYSCSQSGHGGKRADPDYTLRAWRAVVTYLLRQEEFLYE